MESYIYNYKSFIHIQYIYLYIEKTENIRNFIKIYNVSFVYIVIYIFKIL